MMDGCRNGITLIEVVRLFHVAVASRHYKYSAFLASFTCILQGISVSPKSAIQLSTVCSCALDRSLVATV